MHIDNINTALPVNNTIQQVQRIEGKGLDQYESKSRSRDGIIYIGYRTNYKNNTYPPPGKETKGTVEPGEILDIYV